MTDTNNDLAVKTNFQPEDLVSLTGESITTTSLKVAEFFGKEHRDVLKKIQNLDCSTNFMKANFCAFVQMVDMPNGGKREQPYYNLTKDGFIFLAMGFTGAKVAQVKEAYINAFNTMQQALEARPQPKARQLEPLEKIQASLSMIETASNILNLAESSKLGALHKIQDLIGIPDLLPVYAIDAPISSTTGSSDPTMSLSAILKERGLDMSAQTANKILINKGILERRSRPSSKGKDKQFNSLTDLGLEYGKNVVSPSNPRETAPHYYISMIDDLVDILLGATP